MGLSFLFQPPHREKVQNRGAGESVKFLWLLLAVLSFDFLAQVYDTVDE